MAKQFEYEKMKVNTVDGIKILNQKGKEGWELVSTYAPDGANEGKEGWELVSTYAPDGANAIRNVYGILKREITPEIQQEQKQTQ